MDEYRLIFNFFDVGAGDAIWINFLGDDDKRHHIFLDGGYGYAYKMGFGPLLKDMIAGGLSVDLWAITHIDLDHIGAVLSFVQDNKIHDKSALMKSYWFNYTGVPVPKTNGKIGVQQGIDLRDYLAGLGNLPNEKITTASGEVNLSGLKLTILSPTPEKLSNVEGIWSKEELNGKVGRSESDHNKKIEDFDGKAFSEDGDPVNASSIAFLLEYQGLKALFLADSHPSDIVTSLMALGYSKENPLNIEFAKISHHGSKANTSPELLEMINTANFLFTANGVSNKHPDKECLARILTGKTRQKHLNFIFSSKTDEIKNLFAVDDDPYAKYNFSCLYIANDSNRYTLTFLPIKKDDSE
ncbi:ComEC/Rec2 family competence protein [Mucilaginibacter polytrichastri]|uniref:Metallo-beta-lactamase domain-containing protein n=1 Tax=Mucilaginibacter polytrichastri TaxID=1302689 RepID=A0A1Q6A3X9_9SPHI|nr:hypothetical protein [Mucilaginibacter polytrichastri]OKS88707.1 hypothetical protein RG47T_4185 [Mucilaginibacter polytrichastri]SFT04676.1 Metal-dependent hydrolase, beta-lactamase superfamily II [Mucilaginibacter polytrichastri]